MRKIVAMFVTAIAIVLASAAPAAALDDTGQGGCENPAICDVV